MRSGVALFVAVVLGLGAAPARVSARHGDRCGGWAWRAIRGTISPGRTCQAVILTGDASLAGQSTGRAIYEGDVAARGTHAVTVQRLTDDPGSVQVEVPGGWLLLADGRVGFYTSEQQWATTGYRPLPPQLEGWRVATSTRVELRLGADEVVARLDGVEVGRWALGQRAERGSLSVWVTAPRGTRPRVRVSDWTLTR